MSVSGQIYKSDNPIQLHVQLTDETKVHIFSLSQISTLSIFLLLDYITKQKNVIPFHWLLQLH